MAIANVNSVTINNASGTNGYGPFYGITTINSVELNFVPWTNDSMHYAFSRCHNLNGVYNINENITNMSSTFLTCPNLVNAPVIPNSVINMYQAFVACSNLVNAPVIPNSVTDMMSTFQGCYNLVNAPVIPNSVTNMALTFNYCNRLVNAPVIPSSVTNMYGTFMYCRNLVIPPDMSNATNVIYMIGTFNNCINMTTAPVIPSSVENVSWAFFQCNNLEGDIYIHSVNVIQAAGFLQGTSKSKNVYIPYNDSARIYTKTYNAFNNAGYKTSTTQHGVSIKENPFYETYDNKWWWYTLDGTLYNYIGSETAIVVPTSINGVATKYSATFNNNPSVISIDYKNISAKNFCRQCYNCQKINSIKNLPQDIEDMSYAFYYCNKLTSFPTIPSTVKNMAYAFTASGMNTGTSIKFNLPPNVEDLTGCFRGFTGLTTAPTLPNSVVNIAWAFDGCNKLATPPTIPENVVNMVRAFNCAYNIRGNLYVKSFKVAAADQFFYNLQGNQKRLNVYIPFKNFDGSWSATYNAFTSAGYTTTGSFQNVYLMNYTALYT